MLSAAFMVRDECYSGNINLEITEIYEAREKLKWLKRFSKAYSVALNTNIAEIYERSRFFLATMDGKEAGFIRIVDYTQQLRDVCAFEVWSASDAYVKQAYRSKGILRAMIDHVVRAHKVKMAFISAERLTKYCEYYNSLGFVCRLNSPDPTGRHIFAITAELAREFDRYRDM